MPTEAQRGQLERYGYYTRQATLFTRCGCKKTVDLAIDAKGVPHAVGVPLAALSSLAGLVRETWAATPGHDPRVFVQANERIFLHTPDTEFSPGSEIGPLHYLEAGDAVNHTAPTVDEVERGVRLIDLE